MTIQIQDVSEDFTALTIDQSLDRPPEHQRLREKVARCSATIRDLNRGISKEEIERWVIEAERTVPEEPILISNKVSHLGRSLLLSPSGNYALLTRTKQGDKPVGSGAFKKAKRAVNLGTGKIGVVATCKKENCSDKNWAALQDEIHYMTALKGKEGVIQIDTAVTTPDKCYIVMEYCDEGELFDFIVSNSLEREDRFQIARDCAAGLENIHASGLLHRDIKPENVFLYNDENGRLRAKIGDLGLACPNDNQAKLQEFCGSPIWVPPEKAVLAMRRPLPSEVAAVTTSAADVWTLGVLYYDLFNPRGDCLSNQNASTSESSLRKTAGLTQEALDQEIHMSGIDLELIFLIRDMLRINPAERPTMKQVQQALRTIG